jgi:PAS domain S-box-containing protein
MALSVENKIRIGVVCVLIALAVNASLSYRATQRLINNERRVTHTYRVLSQLEAVLSTIKDAETGERGYIITGSEEYLQPYHTAIREIDGELKTLAQFVADNPDQQRRLPLLQSKIQERLSSLQTGIDLRSNGDTESARQLVESGVGKRMMDDVRKSISEMETEEDRLLAERMEDTAESQRDTLYTFIIANVIAGGLLITVAMAVLNGIRLRHSAQDALNEQRQLLQVTISSIADAVIVCDNDGSISFLNPVAEMLTGWTQAEAAGQSVSKVFNIINESTRAPVENPALRAMREGTIVGLANHTVLIRKDGEEVPIDDSGAPIKSAEGKIMGAVLICRDISDRRRSERERAQLLAAERASREHAEAASRSKDQFLAILSHELKTPLTAVFGWVQLLKFRQVDAATMEKALSVMDRNLRIQTQLIDDLLNVSQIITGKLQIHPEMVDAVENVKAAIETVRPSANAKQIAVQLQSGSNLPAIAADPARLQQIVWNLISNAVKFSPKGSSVVVSLRAEDKHLLIKVADTGEGIPPEFLPHVFDRFSQADGSKTRLHGGLGLGLALVRQLVEMHGGTVQAESAGVGQGSVFTIALPITRGGEKRSLPKGKVGTEQARGSLTGISILLAEDEPDTREMIAHVLEQFGASVKKASSAGEALNEIAIARPDILISDIAMPDADGYRLMDMIRAVASVPPPAIALTGYSSPADKERALQAGFRAHLDKPVEISEVVTTVLRVLGRSV